MLAYLTFELAAAARHFAGCDDARGQDNRRAATQVGSRRARRARPLRGHGARRNLSDTAANTHVSSIGRRTSLRRVNIIAARRTAEWQFQGKQSATHGAAERPPAPTPTAADPCTTRPVNLSTQSYARVKARRQRIIKHTAFYCAEYSQNACNNQHFCIRCFGCRR